MRRKASIKTLADIMGNQDGGPIRLRDMVAITGMSRLTLLGDIERGVLVSWRRDRGKTTPILIERRDVLSYLQRIRKPSAA